MRHYHHITLTAAASCLALTASCWSGDYVVALAPATDQAEAQATIEAVRDWWANPQEVKGGDTLRIYGTAKQTLSKPIEAGKSGGWLSGLADSREDALEGLADDMKAALLGSVPAGSAGNYASPTACLSYLTTRLPKAPAGVILIGTPLNRDPRDPRNDQLADNRYRWPTVAYCRTNFAQGSLCLGGLPKWSGGETRFASTLGLLDGASVPRDLVERQAWLVQEWCSMVGARSMGFETSARAALSAGSGGSAAAAARRDLPSPDGATMMEEKWPVVDLAPQAAALATAPAAVAVQQKIEPGKGAFAANTQGSEYEVHDYHVDGGAVGSVILSYDFFGVPDSIKVIDPRDGSVVGVLPPTAGAGEATFAFPRPLSRFRIQVNEPGTTRGSSWTYTVTAK